MPVSVPYRSNDALAASAYQWLQQHHESLEPPIPVEEILEFVYGITPFPIPGMEDTYGVVGSIGAGLDTLYVDEWVMMKQPGRYNFTIAHEIGHLVLHRDVLAEWEAAWQAVPSQDIDAWVRFQQEMDAAVLRQMEYQANEWARHALVPHQPLCSAVDVAMLDYEGKREAALQQGRDVPEDTFDVVMYYLTEQLAPIFKVSPQIIRYRIENERLFEPVGVRDDR
jgi:hypothetical protein